MIRINVVGFQFSNHVIAQPVLAARSYQHGIQPQSGSIHRYISRRTTQKTVVIFGSVDGSIDLMTDKVNQHFSYAYDVYGFQLKRVF